MAAPAAWPGPYEQPPTGAFLPLGERRALLDAVLEGLAVGAYERVILDWLSTWETNTVLVVAGLLHRAHHATPPPGHHRQDQDGNGDGPVPWDEHALGTFPLPRPSRPRHADEGRPRPAGRRERDGRA
jgi:hypothetical protein